MDNVRTLTTNKSGSENCKQNCDWKTTTGFRLDGKQIKMDIDCEPISIDTATPTDLTPHQAFELFENIEPRKWSLEQKLNFQSVFTTEEIDGKLLLRALTDKEIKDEIIKNLKLNLKTKTEFNDFLKRLKDKQDELDKKDKPSTSDAAIPSVVPQQPVKPKSVQNISNSKCVIGEMHNQSTHQNVNNACEFYGGIKEPNVQ